MGRVEGKVAFITGAGQGQGRWHAIRLAEEGADIIATDMCKPYPDFVRYKAATADDLDETRKLVEKTGRRCVTAVADVQDRAALQAAVDRGVETFGRLDVVCANAGAFTLHMSSLEIPDEVFDYVIATNLKGVWNTIQTTAPAMIKFGNGGSMILTSSSAGIRGQTHYAHYAASKHGVVGLMRTFANELGEYRIRVNTIHPTGVASPGMGNAEAMDEIYNSGRYFMLSALNTLPDLDSDPGEEFTPVPMLQEVEISNAVVFLASDEARYIHGVTLPVDAGNTNTP